MVEENFFRSRAEKRRQGEAISVDSIERDYLRNLVLRERVWVETEWLVIVVAIQELRVEKGSEKWRAEWRRDVGREQSRWRRRWEEEAGWSWEGKPMGR